MARSTRKRSASGATSKGSGKDSRESSAGSRRRASNFPIIVVGASAGGLSAFKKFLAATPADSGMAFVLVPHLDPTHKSLMSEILAKHTKIPVEEAANETPILCNHVYIIPPNKYLAIKKRRLILCEPIKGRGQTAIDFALCSTAKDQKEAAIGIVLSGTGSHGALGAKDIKLSGGIVMVQEPSTAEHGQMPLSALATGLVDNVLAPEEMPSALLKYSRPSDPSVAGAPDEAALDEIRVALSLVQASAKYDFRHYRRSMVVRRIRRRMTLLEIDDFPAYIDYLSRQRDEVAVLRRDLLIGVTHFFRDPDAFSALAKLCLPKIVAKANGNEPVRVWVPGCATGEEAYSIAMLLIEQFRQADKAPDFQIFATDIDDSSLETARNGVYSDSVVRVLSQERLQRFFVRSSLSG